MEGSHSSDAEDDWDADQSMEGEFSREQLASEFSHTNISHVRRGRSYALASQDTPASPWIHQVVPPVSLFAPTYDNDGQYLNEDCEVPGRLGEDDDGDEEEEEGIHAAGDNQGRNDEESEWYDEREEDGQHEESGDYEMQQLQEFPQEFPQEQLVQHQQGGEGGGEGAISDYETDAPDSPPIDPAAINPKPRGPRHLAQLRDAIRTSPHNPDGPNFQNYGSGSRNHLTTASDYSNVDIGAEDWSHTQGGRGRGIGRGRGRGRGRSRSNDLLPPAQDIREATPPSGRGRSQSDSGPSNAHIPQGHASAASTGQGTGHPDNDISQLYTSRISGSWRGTINAPANNRGHSRSPFKPRTQRNEWHPGQPGNSPWGPPLYHNRGSSYSTPAATGGSSPHLPATPGNLPEQPKFATQTPNLTTPDDAPHDNNPMNAGPPGTFAAQHPDLSDIDITQGIYLHLNSTNSRLSILERHAQALNNTVDRLSSDITFLSNDILQHTALYRSDQSVLLPLIDAFAESIQAQDPPATARWRRDIDRSLRHLRRDRQAIESHEAQLGALAIFVNDVRGSVNDVTASLGLVTGMMARFVGRWDREREEMHGMQVHILGMVSWLEGAAIAFSFLGWFWGLFAFWNWNWGRWDVNVPPHERVLRGRRGMAVPPPPPGAMPVGPPMGGNVAGGGGGGGGGAVGNSGGNNEPPPPLSPPLGGNGESGGAGAGTSAGGGGGGGDPSGDNAGNSGAGDGVNNVGNHGDENNNQQFAAPPQTASQQTPAQNPTIQQLGLNFVDFDQAASGPSNHPQPTTSLDPPHGHVNSPYRADGLPWQTYNPPDPTRRPSDPLYEPPERPTPLFAHENELSRQRAITAALASRRSAKDKVITLFLFLLFGLSLWAAFHFESLGLHISGGWKRDCGSDSRLRSADDGRGAYGGDVGGGGGNGLGSESDDRGYGRFTKGVHPTRGAWLDEPVMRALFASQKEARAVAELAGESAEGVLGCAKLVSDLSSSSSLSSSSYSSAEVKQDWQGRHDSSTEYAERKCNRAVRLGAEVQQKMAQLAGRLEWVFGERWWVTVTGAVETGETGATWGSRVGESGDRVTVATTTDVVERTATETGTKMKRQTAGWVWPKRRVPAWM